MNTFDLNHHSLCKDEMIMVVPDSLQWNKTIIKIMEKLNKCGISVIPTLYRNGMDFAITYKHGCGNVYIPHDTADSKVITIIINQFMDTKMRDKIKAICDGKFDKTVRFDLFIEEQYGRTFINSNFLL